MTSSREGIRSQFVTGSQKHRNPRYLPYRFLGRRTACALQICKTIEKGVATMNLITYSHVIGNASSGYSHVSFVEGVRGKIRMRYSTYGLILVLPTRKKQPLLTLSS